MTNSNNVLKLRSYWWAGWKNKNKTTYEEGWRCNCVEVEGEGEVLLFAIGNERSCNKGCAIIVKEGMLLDIMGYDETPEVAIKHFKENGGLDREPFYYCYWEMECTPNWASILTSLIEDDLMTLNQAYEIPGEE